MIEISITELALLVWAVCATSGYFNQRHQAHMAHVVLIKFMEDKEVRDKMLKEFERVQRG
jgi:hypothetical protein